MHVTTKNRDGKDKMGSSGNNPLLVYEVASAEDECANIYNMFRFEFIILKKIKKTSILFAYHGTVQK